MDTLALTAEEFKLFLVRLSGEGTYSLLFIAVSFVDLLYLAVLSTTHRIRSMEVECIQVSDPEKARAAVHTRRRPQPQV
jgi:hypothetical protein